MSLSQSLTKSMRDASCAAIILAAGPSSRLPQPKQLLTTDGESLLRRTSRLALDAGFSPVVVVLGSEAPKFEPELRNLNVRTVLNRKWQDGMASSLKCGLAAIEALNPIPANLLVLVCDQPKLSQTILQALLNKHHSSKAQITASTYAGTRGVPAIFSQTVFPELADLRGDQGARRIIARDPRRVETVDFPGGADDIDTEADLHRAGITARD